MVRRLTSISDAGSSLKLFVVNVGPEKTVAGFHAVSLVHYIYKKEFQCRWFHQFLISISFWRHFF